MKIFNYEQKQKNDAEYNRKWDELENNYKKHIEELKKSKLSDEEKWQKEIDLDHQLTIDKRNLRNKYITDSKKPTDANMYLDKNNVFTNKNKEFKVDESHEKKDITKLTNEEKEAITHYTSQWGYGNYSDINTILYKPDASLYGEGKAKAQEAIAKIDSAMSKCTLGQDCQVYRGIESNKLNNEKIAKIVDKFNKGAERGSMIGLEKSINDLKSLVGTELDNKGYMSTSTSFDPNYAKRGVTLVINAKSSDRAIHVKSLSKYGDKQDTFMAAFSKGPIQHEDEILFNRGTKLKIVDVAVTESGVQLLCDTVSNKSSNHAYKSKKKVNGEWVYEY